MAPEHPNSFPSAFLQRIKYYSIPVSESDYALMKLNMLKFWPFHTKAPKVTHTRTKPAQGGSTKVLQKPTAHQDSPELSAGSLLADGAGTAGVRWVGPGPDPAAWSGRWDTLTG